MSESMRELFLKPMITGVAAGVFPTLLVLYGVQQTMGELRVREQLVSKESENHAALLEEKVRLIAEMAALQEKYALLIDENGRLSTRLQAAAGPVAQSAAPAAQNPASQGRSS